MPSALIFLCWLAGASPAPALPPEAAAAELQKLTEERFQANARNDRGFYERLLAPTFLFMDPHGFPPHTKDAYLAAEFPAGRPSRPPGTLSDFRALVDGDTAVVSYQATEPTPLGGDQQFKLVSRRLDTYARIGGAWRLLSMAIAEPPSWPDVAVVAPRLYDEYAGTYELSPEMRVVVTNESGHLMAEVTGQPKVELFPENETTFFDRSDSPLARTVFERDDSGRVVGQTYRALGQKLRARRVLEKVK